MHAGPVRVTTDNRGIFSVTNITPGSHQLRVDHPLYSLGQASVQVTEGSTTWLELVVQERVAAPLADSAQGGVLRKDQVSVALPGGVLETSMGLSVSGSVEARLVAIPLAKRHLPVPEGVAMQPLSFSGACELRFYQGDESLTLDSGATLTFPLGPNEFTDGSELELLWFDEQAGTWQRRGSASLVANTSRYGSAKARIDRFGWWSVGTQLTDTSCVSGRFAAGGSRALKGLTLYATDLAMIARLSATTSDTNEGCLSLRRNAKSLVSGFGGDEHGFYEIELPVTTDNATRICGTSEARCADLDSPELRRLFPACSEDGPPDLNHVLLLSSGRASLDARVRETLELGGNQVTQGPAYTDWDGSSDLAPYDVVYLQDNANDRAGDMPESGQRQLVDWVNCGGGLLTVEYTVSSGASFSVLQAIFPARAATTLHGHDNTTTYERVGADSVVHHALAESFSFSGDFYDSERITESDLIARPGATVFYDSATRRNAVVGWDLHRGRVLSLSTAAGENALSNESYRQLLLNAVEWLQRDQHANPEP